MSEERLNDLVKFWDKQRPTMCTIDEDDIASIKCLLQKNQELQNINDKLSSALNSAEKRIDKAIEIAYQYAQIDGDHHKMWVIDQIIRKLLKNNYDNWVKEYEEDGEYLWDTGINP